MDSELTKVEKLEKSNWTQWKFIIKVHLKASDLYGVVSGEMKKPVLTEENNDARKSFEDQLLKWTKADNRAQKIIVSTIGQQPLLLIMVCETSKDMWDKLHSVYELKSESSLHMVLQKFYKYVMDPRDNIATHVSKLEELGQQLKQLGNPVSDAMMITKVLMTLPPSYNHFHSAWESTEEGKRSLSNLTSRLLVEESRLSNQLTENTTEALAARQGNRQGNKPFDKKNMRNSWKPGKCFYCQKEGHWKHECKFRKKKPKENVATAVANSGIDAFIGQAELLDEADENIWYLDSGASDHMTNRIEWFINYVELTSSKFVKIGNGTKLTAYGKGDIKVLALANNQWNEKLLKDVLYVPEMKLNLFSSGTALDKGYNLFADNKVCQLIKDGKVVAEGVRRNRLYKLLFHVQNPESQANIVTKDSIQLWHERLVHQNFNHVHKVMNELNMKLNGCWSEDTFCDACLYGKQHRKPFISSSTKTENSGEIVHADLCGPMQIASVGGSYYFLLFKDDFSHYKNVYFLKNKSEVSGKIQEYLKIVKSDTGFNVKSFRSDNGLEFTNSEVTRILKQFGVRHQTSVPYTPEQNGAVEREIRTIVEGARTLIHAKNLPIKLWAEAVNTMVYVLNRTGTSSVKNKTPFELWYGQKANISYFKVFGTEVFAHVPKQKRRKWDAKSKNGFFVGYKEGVKGYRIWYPNEDKVEMSRDVVFKNECEIVKKISSNEKQPETGLIFTEPVQEYSGENVEEKEVDREAEEIKKYEIMINEPEQNDNEKNDTRRYNLRDRSQIKKPDGMLAEAVALLAQNCEAITYEEAISGRNSKEWKTAMNEEMNSLRENETWTLTTLPPDKQTIPNRWVFKVKRKANGDIDRFKARLVIKGYHQRHNIDYQEVFSPVVRFESVRAILSIAAREKLKLAQFDVTTAFLYGNLNEDIYMDQPIGYEDGSDAVCKLNKSLYGLKQAPRCWNEKFKNVLRDYNLKMSKADSCVFYGDTNGQKLILAIYVDDGLVAATCQNVIDNLFDHLKTTFHMEIGNVDNYLGLEVNMSDESTIFVHQSGYTKKILNKFHMLDSKPVSTPIDETTVKESFTETTKLVGDVPYREAVGSLMYLSVATRPDITFAVHFVSQYLEKPSQSHWKAVKRIFRYLNGTINYGLLFQGQHYNLQGFSDADFAGDMNSRRSTTGYVFKFGTDTISWCSQKQNSVSLSTTEAEYIAASTAVTELVWLVRLLTELSPVIEKSIFYVYNQSAIKLIKNPEFHKRTKHVDIRYHYIREKYEEKVMDIEYLESKDQIADVLTKALGAEKFRNFRSLLGVKIIRN